MKVIIRVDSSTQIGTGHVMRCIALAQAWQQEGGQAIFAMATAPPALEARLQIEQIRGRSLFLPLSEVDDSRQTIAIAQEAGASWVVIDGYQFGAEYQHAIQNAGLKMLFIDDYGHSKHYYADLVLNQNISAYDELYTDREDHTQLLLGTDYVLLRKEFWPWRGWQRQIPSTARKVLVTLGGADPENITLKVVQALKEVDVDGLEVMIVVGGNNPYHDCLQAAIQEFPKFRIQRNITNMPELMVWADVAIIGGGSTSWEVAFMGLPSLILTLADNQRAIAEKLGLEGIAVNLGWYQDVCTIQIKEALEQLLFSSRSRRSIAYLGQKLIDGHGSQRVVTEIMEAGL